MEWEGPAPFRKFLDPSLYRRPLYPPVVAEDPMERRERIKEQRFGASETVAGAKKTLDSVHH